VNEWLEGKGLVGGPLPQPLKDVFLFSKKPMKMVNHKLMQSSLSLFLFFLLLLTTSFQCKKESSGNGNPSLITLAELEQIRVPLFIGRANSSLATLKLNVTADDKPLVINGIEVVFSEGSHLIGISSVGAKYSFIGSAGTNQTIGSSSVAQNIIAFKQTIEMGTGTHFINFDFILKPDVDLLTSFRLEKVKLTFKNYESVEIKPFGKFIHRPALVLRAAGQDNCNTYRIPGLVTTNRGTLIAVYDNRYNNSKDLQEDIDIGMSRSTDGGQTWAPMKVIMDMGEYGGRPQHLNGIGDPCVLYDPVTNTLWVAALWMSGSNYDQMLWWASKPGLKPDETGQLVLVKSTDDGLTWSQPINITSQIKDPSWQLLLQGPGRGITMKDGTLVFPAQFKADIGTKAIDGGQYSCHSTIVYSKDSGKTWKIGTGAKSNTTEAQVVELANGSLMLNMRDDRNRSDKGATNGRAVATTSDSGKTWTTHSSSNSALPEPNCQASIIGIDVKIDGKIQHILFFSNPNNKNARTNMTIKASLDEGKTWPSQYQLELNAATGYGYSCMTLVDAGTLGILYEGEKELFFQKVAITDILYDLKLN
jgi:sialidase-1